MIRHIIKRGLFRIRNKSPAAPTKNSSTTKLNEDEIGEQLATFEGGAVLLHYVTTKSEHNIAVITIDNPSKKNAFTGSMCVQLNEISKQLQDWTDGSALIIKGSSGMFCAGADLNMARQIADSTNGDRFSFYMQNVLRRIHQLHIPSIALCRDHVFGGGAELMVACDYIVVSPYTQICFVQGKMGIVPGWGGATHLVSKVGYPMALDFLLSGRILTAEQAQASNLITDILPHEAQDEKTFLDQGLKFVNERFGKLPSDVIRGMKQSCLGAQQLNYEHSMENERKVFKTLWGGESNLKALKLFSKFKS